MKSEVRIRDDEESRKAGREVPNSNESKVHAPSLRYGEKMSNHPALAGYDATGGPKSGRTGRMKLRKLH
jgi:hypothetical protein